MSSDVKVLMSRLGSFRPSDRAHLQSYLNDPGRAGNALQAIREFVQTWEEADWLEAYSVERIGKWLGKNQTAAVVDNLLGWTRLKGSDARKALAAGLEKGRNVRVPEPA